MAALSPQSSTSSLSSTESPRLTQDDGSSTYSTTPSPCSPSILLNPLPPTTIKNGKRRMSVLITHQPSPPPAHFLAENPSYRPQASPPNAFPESRLRSSSARPPNSRSGSDSFIETASSNGSQADPDEKGKGKLSFAPLPPGRRAYRSNSLTLGVAARAKMINSQGCGSNASYSSSPRYGGPQQWYQTGGTVPADVYTIDDVKKGIGKLWTKVKNRRGSTASSTSSADAQIMEQEGKGKSKEIEHIEECEEEDGDEAFIDDIAREECEEEEETRGRSLGLVLNDDSSVGSSASTGSFVQPRTPSDSVEDIMLDPKGKGVEGRATSRAVAL